MICNCARQRSSGTSTLQHSHPLGSQMCRRITFREWTNGREITSLGTNMGAESLPFQDWCKIKEAFAPELVERAVVESPISVSRCIDPFGGSGTTGLACQFLGVHPLLGEVNPYLADLIETKLTQYPSSDPLICDLDFVVEAGFLSNPDRAQLRFESAPTTLVEPGHNDRWIFNADVASYISTLLDAIESLDERSSRLFRVLLGGILVDVSNIRVTGKGRRYRGGWKKRRVEPSDVAERFAKSAKQAINDISRFADRWVNSYEILRGDSRAKLQNIEPFELAVFSPPYPNSFDYTDVYNVELWALGYLEGPIDNHALRMSTLSSHLQVAREFAAPPIGSTMLKETLEKLEHQKKNLWIHASRPWWAGTSATCCVSWRTSGAS